MGYEHVRWGTIPTIHIHTQRLRRAEGEGAFTHAHKTIPICLRRQTPLLGFLGSRSCMNMWKRNVSLLSTGHTCNSIYCSHVQEIHQTGPISNHREKQSIRDGGKSTPNSILYFILIGLDCERRRRSHRALRAPSSPGLGDTGSAGWGAPAVPSRCRCSRSHLTGGVRRGEAPRGLPGPETSSPGPQRGGACKSLLFS